MKCFIIENKYTHIYKVEGCFKQNVNKKYQKRSRVLDAQLQ